jgi:putative SOS response-associated peptidase YedK
MCGRYSFAASKEKIQKQQGIKIQGVMQPNYNVAPTTLAYVIASNNPTELQRFQWGLIPHWTGAQPINSSNLINARAEGIASKPSFRIPIRQRRCIVLADSFYEWANVGGKEKQPYRILLKDNGILPMAGIWDVWERPDRQIVYTFAIITTEANADISHIHDRMPVILQTQDAQKNWLSEGANLPSVLELLQPLPQNLLRMYAVSPVLNSVSVASSPELHKEVAPPMGLF